MLVNNVKFLTIDENADSAFGLSSVANFDNQVTKVFLRWRLLCKHNKTKITLSTRPIPVAYAWLCVQTYGHPQNRKHITHCISMISIREGLTHGHKRHAKSWWSACVVFEICEEKKTNIQTRWPQYLAPPGANVHNNVSYHACNVCCNKSVFSFYMSTWHCWAQSAAVRRAAAPLLLGATVDRYLPPARCSAANPPQRYAAGEWCDRRTDRQTDLWTPDRFIDPAPHTTPALRPISKNQ